MTHDEFLGKAKLYGGIVAAILGVGWKLNDSLRDTIRSEVRELRETVAALPTKRDVDEAQARAVKAARATVVRMKCPAFSIRGQQYVICETLPEVSP